MALGNNLTQKRQTTTSKEQQKKAANTETIAKAAIHPQEENSLERVETEMLIVFKVGREDYALPIDAVREIVKTPPIAPIPQLPDFVRGVVNVRGSVFAVLDLAAKMGLSGSDNWLPNHLMVIKSEEYKIAVGIDQVPNTLKVEKSQIDYSADIDLHSTRDQNFIKGILKVDKQMIILVDVLEMTSLGLD